MGTKLDTAFLQTSGKKSILNSETNSSNLFLIRLLLLLLFLTVADRLNSSECLCCLQKILEVKVPFLRGEAI